MACLPSFNAFEVHQPQTNLAACWNKWLKRFEIFLQAMNITDNARKKAMLLHYAGEEVYDIFTTLPNTGEDSDYEVCKAALSKHFSPHVNAAFEIFKFRQTKQSATESIDEYHVRLRQLAAYCEFADTNKEIQMQIIQGCVSSKLRRQALRDPSMTLAKLLDTARIHAAAENQAKLIETMDCMPEQPSLVAKLNQKPHVPYKQAATCYNCGGSYPHQNSCPARGVTCHNCGKQNHFAKVCRSNPQSSPPSKQSMPQRVQAVQSVSDNKPSSTYLFSVTEEGSHYVRATTNPKQVILINGTPVETLVDTGASVNVISHAVYNKLKNRPVLQYTNLKIFPYGSDTALPLCGKFQSELTSDGKSITDTFYVVKCSADTLLSCSSAVSLGLVKLVNSVTRSSIHNVMQKYPQLFQGLGKLKDFQVKLHIDQSVQPSVQPHRRIPFHVRKLVEKELQDLEASDVIERVEGPTPWVSPIVVAPKPKQPGKIRLCVDMRHANRAVQRERHITPTIDDILTDLNGAKIFSKIDLKSGYHQLELHPDSRYITTFSTHIGLRRFKRLNFGISSAAEIFQNVIRQVLSGIPGVLNVSDDILIFGTTQEEHDNHLEQVFQRLQTCNLTVNPSKCEFNKKSLNFFGYVFSENGISADPQKIAAITSASQPQHVSDVRSFLGLVTYCGRFIPDLASVSEPLRHLTKKDAPWLWTAEHQTAFDTLKSSLTSDTVMAYFDPLKSTELIVDASPVGLGAILTQVSKTGSISTISYASKALTETEQRYSQTEREALAIVWGCLHFHLYLFGRPFTVVSDHKPLIPIFNKHSSKPPPRLERWLLRLQNYHFHLRYEAGAGNPADYFSRHPSPQTAKDDLPATLLAEEHVNFIVAHSIPRAMTLEEVKQALQSDPLLQLVIATVRSKNWNSFIAEARLQSQDQTATAQAFFNSRHSLSVSDSGLLLRDNRLVIPQELQAAVLDLAHEAHQGVVKTKQLLREKVWFPGLDKKVEALIETCIPCQATRVDHSRAPLQMSPLPKSPWTAVSVDFCTLPDHSYLLVVIDDFSRFPVIEPVSTTSARVVIPKLDKIFSAYGIPETVKTDNGPPFSSADFQSFATYLGFTHRKITPYWPQANGEVERFMQSINKTLRIATMEHKDLQQELYRFLRQYRATPHSTTGIPPATALFNRPLRIKLPDIPVISVPTPLTLKDSTAKARMKRYADKGSHHSKQLEVGDWVLVRRLRPSNKLSSPYHPEPFRVTNVKGTMVTAQHQDRQVTRNVSHFKKLWGYDPGASAEEVDDEEILPDTNGSATTRDASEDLPVSTYSPRYPTRSRRPPTHLMDYVLQ